MNKRGLVIAGVGAAIFGVSLVVAMSIVESDFAGPVGFDTDAVFEDMFDDITDEITVLPGSTERATYSVESDGVLVMWAVQMLDYEEGDSLLVTISGYDGTPHGTVVLDAELQIDAIESAGAGTLYFDMENAGSDSVRVIAMFSEDPNNSEMFTDPDSLFNKVVMPLAISGIIALVGLIILIVGLVIFLIDMRRRQRVGGQGGRWSDGRFDGR